MTRRFSPDARTRRASTSTQITLHDGRTIRGPLSGIVYVRAEGQEEPERFLLHKRDKGPIGVDLKALRLRQVDPARREGPGRRQAASGEGPRGRARARARTSDGALRRGSSWPI